MRRTVDRSRTLRGIGRAVRLGLCLGLLVFLGRPGATLQAEPAAREAQQLDAYLARLGLSAWRLAHLERRLRQGSEPVALLVEQLEQVAGEALTAAAAHPPRLAALQDRLRRLWDDLPATRTDAFELVLLQGEFQQAETQIVRWLEDPSLVAARDQARPVLLSLVPRLARLSEQLAQAAERLEKSLEMLTDSTQQATAEQRLFRQRTLAARADYFLGWAACYAAALRVAEPETATLWTTARRAFCRILELPEEEEYGMVQSRELGLGSVWRGRAVIGLALAEIGLGNLAAAERVLGWLDDPAAVASLRDQTDYWRVQGLLWTGRFAEAAERVERAVTAFSETPSPGKSSLCLSAIRTARSGTEMPPDVRRRLVLAGVRGLARMRQFATLDELGEREGWWEAAPDREAFVWVWLRGRRLYLAGEQSRDPALWQQAEQTLDAALAMEEARRDLAGAAQARFYLAWARYRQGANQDAARAFQEAAAALRDSGSALAVQAAWMQCVCLAEWAERDPRQVPAALMAVAALKRDYPHSPEVQRAEWLAGRLRRMTQSPEAALRELAAISPGDAQYAAAQGELCELRYQQWERVRSDPQQAAPLAQEVQEAARRLVDLTLPPPQAALQVRAALRAVAVLRAMSPGEDRAAARWLERIRPAVAHLEPSSPPALEYQFRRLELAQHQQDHLAARQAAEHLSVHGRGTAYEAAGLVVLAQAAEGQARTAEPDQQVQAWRQTEEFYARLVVLLGDTPDAWLKDPKAAAAAARLVACHEQLGRWPEAADRLNRLVVAFPKDRSLLQRAGRACFAAGRHAEALTHWRTLLAGLPAGSEEWFEAKYYQVACLLQTDRPAAERVLQQLDVLYPEVPSAEWGSKLMALRRQAGR